MAAVFAILSLSKQMGFDGFSFGGSNRQLGKEPLEFDHVKKVIKIYIKV